VGKWAQRCSETGVCRDGIRMVLVHLRQVPSYLIPPSELGQSARRSERAAPFEECPLTRRRTNDPATTTGRRRPRVVA
jgi:hypothetical protein